MVANYNELQPVAPTTPEVTPAAQAALDQLATRNWRIQELYRSPNIGRDPAVLAEIRQLEGERTPFIAAYQAAVDAQRAGRAGLPANSERLQTFSQLEMARPQSPRIQAERRRRTRLPVVDEPSPYTSGADRIMRGIDRNLVQPLRPYSREALVYDAQRRQIAEMDRHQADITRETAAIATAEAAIAAERAGRGDRGIIRAHQRVRDGHERIRARSQQEYNEERDLTTEQQNLRERMYLSVQTRRESNLSRLEAFGDRARSIGERYRRLPRLAKFGFGLGLTGIAIAGSMAGGGVGLMGAIIAGVGKVALRAASALAVGVGIEGALNARSERRLVEENRRDGTRRTLGTGTKFLNTGLAFAGTIGTLALGSWIGGLISSGIAEAGIAQDFPGAVRGVFAGSATLDQGGIHEASPTTELWRQTLADKASASGNLWSPLGAPVNASSGVSMPPVPLPSYDHPLGYAAGATADTSSSGPPGYADALGYERAPDLSSAPLGVTTSSGIDISSPPPHVTVTPSAISPTFGAVDVASIPSAASTSSGAGFPTTGSGLGFQNEFSNDFTPIRTPSYNPGEDYVNPFARLDDSPAFSNMPPARFGGSGLYDDLAGAPRLGGIDSDTLGLHSGPVSLRPEGAREYLNLNSTGESAESGLRLDNQLEQPQPPIPPAEIELPANVTDRDAEDLLGKLVPESRLPSEAELAEAVRTGKGVRWSSEEHFKPDQFSSSGVQPDGATATLDELKAKMEGDKLKMREAFERFSNHFAPETAGDRAGVGDHTPRIPDGSHPDDYRSLPDVPGYNAPYHPFGRIGPSELSDQIPDTSDQLPVHNPDDYKFTLMEENASEPWVRNDWTMTDKGLERTLGSEYATLTEAQRNNIIGNLTREVERNPRSFGIPTDDFTRIPDGTKVDLSKLFADRERLDKLVAHARDIHPGEADTLADEIPPSTPRIPDADLPEPLASNGKFGSIDNTPDTIRHEYGRGDSKIMSQEDVDKVNRAISKTNKLLERSQSLHGVRPRPPIPHLGDQPPAQREW